MKLRNLVLGALALTAFFSCKPEAEPVIEPVLELSTEKLVFGSMSDMKVLNITANNDWTISADVEWLDFSVTSGEASDEKQAVNVYSEDNTALEDRTGKITVTAGGLTKEVAVTQKATEFVAELTLSVTKLTAVAAGEELSFNVTSNVAWTASSTSEWVTIAPVSGEASETAVAVTVTVAANEANEARTAVITVAGQDVEETITLDQEAKPLEAEEMEGDGSEANPYLIKTAAHMLSVRDAATVDATTYFRLENDIDMTPVTNWIPVNFDGTFSRQIHFDGNNKTISNFAPATWNYLAEPEEGSESTEPVEVSASYPSLFGVLYGSCKNLNVTGAKIEGAKSAAGILAGYVGTTDKPASVKNVSVQGSVSGTKDRIGGMAGVAQDADFEDCSADVTIKTSATDAAGFVGKVQGTSSFKGCDVKVVLETSAAEKNRAGGFIGWNGSVKTTIEDCHVLVGSKISDKSSKSAKAAANLGGFIGFGDNAATVLEIKNCSAKADVDAGAFGVQASAFIGTLSYASSVTILNSYAEGTVTAAQNYVSGIVAYNGGGAQLTITGCSFKGTLSGASGVGGIVGGAESAPANISKCYMTGTITTTGHNAGGIVGLVNGAVDIQNCWADVKVNMASTQFGAGIVGGVQQKLSVKNCYALGEVNVSRGAGGIVGQVKNQAPVVEGCIAWNSVTTNRSASQYSPGAIVANIQVDGKFAKCYRKADMSFTDIAMTLVDHDDIENGRPARPVYEGDVAADNNQYAYHGKAAESDDTISSVAKTIGWDETIWDLSGAVPALK